MSYDPIYRLADLDQLTPQGTEAASNLAPATRQVKQFLRHFLAVSLDDDGRLKAESVGSGVVGEGQINSTHLAPNSIYSKHIFSEQIQDWHLEDGAVTEEKIRDNAVTEDKIKNVNVTGDKLASDAVTRDKILNGEVIGSKLAEGAITDSKVTDVSGSKLAAFSVTAGKLEKPTAAGVHLFATQTSGSVLAKVGGVLTANVVDGNLIFALAASGIAEVATLALWEQTATGSITTSWAQRSAADLGSLALGTGMASQINGGLKLANEGTYLVFFSGAGYSCNAHQTALAQGGAAVKVGSTAIAPAASQSYSEGWIVLSCAADTQLTLLSRSQTAFANYGQGYGGGLSGTHIYGRMLVWQLT